MARLIHICPRYWPARGGVESVFERLCEHFAGAGHHVDVWTTDALTVRGLTARGEPTATPEVEVVRGVHVRRFRARRWPAQRVLRTVAHMLPAGRPWHANTLRWTPWVPTLDRACASAPVEADVVHAAGLPYSSLLLAGERLARRIGARWLVSPFTHVPAPGPAGRLMRRAYLSPFNIELLARADLVLAQTEAEHAMLVQAGVADAKVQVLGLGVDVARVAGGDRTAQRRRWGIGDHSVVVGHLANKSRDKGTVDLLEAMPAVWARLPEVRVVLAGTSMPSFADHVARQPLDARVIDLGPLGEPALRDFLSAIDVFAMPSVVESFGLAALEAASTGAAVVVYAHGGPAAIWTDGVDARVVATGDVAALSSAIADLCGDPLRRSRLAEGGRRRAHSFTWAQVFARADRAYGLAPRLVAS